MAGFYTARSRPIPPLPWQTFALPFSLMAATIRTYTMREGTIFCRSTVEIRAHAAAESGLEYSHSGCIKLLARPGF